MNEQELVDEIGLIKIITENAQLAGEWTYNDGTRFVGCQFEQGGKNSVCEVYPALGRSTAALGQFIAMTRTAVPKLIALAFRLIAELAALRQQLAEKESDFQVVKLAVIETEGRCAEFKAMLDDTLKQEFTVRQQLAEARAERDGFQCQLKAFDKLHWELVDMFDKDARGVSPLHYVKERIAAQAAELERLREENQELKGRIGNALL